MSDGKKAVESSKVWTTLLTNLQYLPGLLTLDYSLKKAKSKYPLVVLYTDTLEPEAHTALEQRGIPKQHVKYLLPSVHKDYGVETRFYDCWSKLIPFSLYQYERIVQLDSDMLILKNMDELMELELDPEGDRVFAASHACVCNPLKKPHYPKDWIPSNCAYTSQHSDPTTAQTTGAPTNIGIGFINGGLQVVNPHEKTYNLIASTLSNPSSTANYEFADQSLLSDLFKDRWVALPYIYNALKTLRWCHEPMWRDEDVKNLHYILSPKPWDEDRSAVSDDVNGGASFGERSDSETHKWWWKFNDERKEEESKIKSGGYDAY